MPERIPLRKDLFVESAEGVKLLGNKCKSCGQIFIPKAEAFCLNCCQNELTDVQLGPRGKLYSFTTSGVPAMHYKPPYLVGYVVFDNEVRVFGQLEALPDKPFRIDMEMELFIDKLWEEADKEIIGYKFKPV